MRDVGIQKVFQAVKEGKLEKVRKICENDIPDMPYESLNFQDESSLNGNKPIYDALVGYYGACDAECRAKMIAQINLLVRRSLREAFPNLGNQIDGLYMGMRIPYGRIEVVKPEAFLDTWNDFAKNSLPI